VRFSQNDDVDDQQNKTKEDNLKLCEVKGFAMSSYAFEQQPEKLVV
jgi:hypothetical protein